MRRTGPRLAAAAVLLTVPATLALSAAVSPSLEQRAERTVWDRVYSETQATRGEAFYSRTCERCHQATLMGADQAPALVGAGFVAKWDSLTLGQLHDRIRTTMPPTAPGTLTSGEVADLIAFVLSYNDFPAGKADLPASPDSLRAIRILATPPR